MKFRGMTVFVAIATLVFSMTQASAAEPELVGQMPFRGARVKLARYGGAQFGGAAAGRDGAVRSSDPAWSMVRVTDEKGAFAFPPLEKGQYVLTLERPEENASALRQQGKPQYANVEVALITVESAAGSLLRVGWDFGLKRQYNIVPNTSAKAVQPQPVIIESNGVDPIRGICRTTVVKSRSNTKNN